VEQITDEGNAMEMPKVVQIVCRDYRNIPATAKVVTIMIMMIIIIISIGAI